MLRVESLFREGTEETAKAFVARYGSNADRVAIAALFNSQMQASEVAAVLVADLPTPKDVRLPKQAQENPVVTPPVERRRRSFFRR